MSINLDIILYICGVITSTSAAVAIVIKLINKKITKTIENNKMFKMSMPLLVSQIRYQIDTALRRQSRRTRQQLLNVRFRIAFEAFKGYGAAKRLWVESEMEEIHER